MEARVTSQSQSFRLVERMAEAQIGHGQEVRADLLNVRVLAFAGAGDGQVFFCHVGPIRVRETLTPGDGRPVPTTVTLEGLHVPTSGTYDILNALVCSNGDVRVVVDAPTQVLPVVGGVEAPVVRRYPFRALAHAAR